MSQDDKYTYPGSGGVLVKTRGIVDGRDLDEATNDIASLGWYEVWSEPASGRGRWLPVPRVIPTATPPR